MGNCSGWHAKSASGRLPVSADGFDPSARIVLSSLVDAIRKPQSDYPHKIICLQKVQFDAFVIELHLGYYILRKKPKMHGKWG